MAIKKINDLGGFADLSAVWSVHPEGGREGDYVTINNVAYEWSALEHNWIIAGSGGQTGPASQTIDGDLNVGGNLDVNGNAHIGGDVTIEGELNVSRINFTDPLPEPKDGQSIFKSLVFKRALSRPAQLLPTDGTFYNPVPTAKGWSDGIPAGNEPIWMACRVFTNDGEPPQGNWSTPALMADTESFDVEFSDSISKPANPDESNRHGGTGTQVWFDPVLDAAAFSSRTMRWMASRTRVSTSSGPTWGPWSVILIAGETGADGFGVEFAYLVYNKASAPLITNRRGDVPYTFGYSWSRTTTGLVVGNNQALWMSQRTYSSNVYGLWSDAVRISGDGAPGEDGADIEFIYKQMDRLPTSDDAKPTNNISQDDYVPESEGWYDEAKGVDSQHKCEWMCQRTKGRGEDYWSDWIGPIAWSVYGDTGMDGASVQYVFKRTIADEGTPARPTVTSEGHINEQGEYIPRGWTDDPQGVNEYYVKEWVSIRRKGERQTEWGSFSDPALWATYSKQHTIDIRDGYWWIDGVKTEYKAEGEDGTGIKMKGVVDYYTSSEATSAGGGATSLQDENTASLEVGDCYVIRHGNKEGYIYTYNGGSTWPNNWTELGKFKGADGDPGTSMYLHIAWSYNIDFPNGVPSGAIYTDYASLPIATYGYPDWQGIAVTSSDPNSDNYNPTGEDPTEASAYEWNHVRGKDGSDYEKVYIRTKKNIRPKIDPTIDQTDDYKPLCINGSECEAYYTEPTVGNRVYQFTDDPIGPDENWPYEFMAERKKVDGQWGRFGAATEVSGTTFYLASLWSVYSMPPTITVDSYGYWLINGQRIPDPRNPNDFIRAKGEKGDGIRINGSYASVEDLEESVSLADRHVGDCYYITSGQDAGHLYMWNGENWQNIGEIKGEAGQSQYMFIAWATNVHISGNTVTSVDGFSLSSGSGYNWVGLLAYDSPTLPTIGSSTNDPTKLAFKWNYIKGMDGDQYEYVYTRTTTNDNPGVRNSYSSNYEDSNRTQPDEDEFLPLTTGGTEYTDDPNGVNSTDQFEWECYRRKTAGSWGNWFGPYLVHNWAKDGAGQAYVTANYSEIVVDCGPDGKPSGSTNPRFTVNAQLHWGDYVCHDLDGDQRNNASTTRGYIDTESIQVGDTQFSFDVVFPRATALSSGNVTINLYGLDGDDDEHTATLVIPIRANKQGDPGAPGTPGTDGPCLRFRGEYSPTVDGSVTDGYVWNDTFRDCVKSGSTYYLVNEKTNGGTPLGTPPNNKWLSAGGNLKFFATELLLAENATIELLSTNKLIFLDENGHKTAGINEDGQGSYKTYYTEDPYGIRKDDNANGWTYYHNNDQDNTIAWMIGPSGVIVRNVNITMEQILLSSNTVRRLDYSLDGQDEAVTMATRYIYYNEQSDNNGKIYKSSTLVNNEPTGEVVGNGTYAEAAQPLEDLSDPDNVEYYLPVVVISGGKITRRYEFRRLS